jgi:hypothetical protein
MMKELDSSAGLRAGSFSGGTHGSRLAAAFLAAGTGLWCGWAGEIGNGSSSGMMCQSGNMKGSWCGGWRGMRLCLLLGVETAVFPTHPTLAAGAGRLALRAGIHGQKAQSAAVAAPQLLLLLLS